VRPRTTIHSFIHSFIHSCVMRRSSVAVYVRFSDARFRSVSKKKRSVYEHTVYFSKQRQCVMRAHRRRHALRARGRHASTRGATVRSRVEFHAMGPLGVLNRGTERGGGDEARAPARLKRARRRTKLEVHGDVRTRPVSERLEKRKEPPSPTVPGALLSPFKAPRHGKRERGRT
jgi:hypothetical protein